MIIKRVAIYGISTAVLRGSALIYLPVLLALLSTEQFGLYGLVQTGAQLLVPVLSIGGSVAVIREGSCDSTLGFKYYAKFSFLTAAIGFFATIVCALFDNSDSNWVTFTLAIGTVEALQLLLLSFIHCVNRELHYFLFCCLKVFVLLAATIAIGRFSPSLSEVLLIQLIWSIILIAVYSAITLTWIKEHSLKQASILPTLHYTAPVIPHSMSQWIMSSSDRFIINSFLGQEATGIYNIAYTLAMSIMLLNSGVGLTLPQYVIRHYESWISGTTRLKFIATYSVAVLGFVALLRVFLFFDDKSFGILPIPYTDILTLLRLITAGLYLLGIYYFYMAVLFHHKRTGVVALQTFIASVFNLVLTLYLTPMWGIVGAAVATFLSYGLYMTLSMLVSSKIVESIRQYLSAEVLLVVATTLVILIV